MTVLVIADQEEALIKLPEAPAEVLISCGDIPDGMILFAAERCRCQHILAVKGNHDSSAPFAAPIVDLHERTYKVHGVTFGGFGGAWRYKPEGNFLYEQMEVDDAVAEFPKVDVFVAHNSPRLVHDRDDDVHIGFAAFNTYLDRVHPRWLLHGHQHVNAETMVGSTRVVGTYGFRFLVIPE